MEILWCKVDEVKGGKKSFDQHLTNVAPCDDENYTPNENSNHFLSLDPDLSFMWDFEEAAVPRESIPPTGWLVVDNDDQ